MDYPEQLQLQSAAPEGGEAGRGIGEIAHAGIAGHGGTLPHQARIQASFGGYDISNVQAHTDSAATEASAGMGADAYATGNHVALGAGGRDLHTVAHEAAHVVQQRHGVSLSGGVGQAGDPYERHADAVADAVVAGRSAEGLLGQMAGGGPVQKQAATQLHPASDSADTLQLKRTRRSKTSKKKPDDGKTMAEEADPTHDVEAENEGEVTEEELNARALALQAKANEEMKANAAETEALTAALFAEPTYKAAGRVVIGDGFAAVVNVASLPEVVGGKGHNVIGVGFKGEPWIRRGDLAMGQAPHILDAPGFVTRPWAYRETKDERRQKYLRSEDFGRSIAQTRNAIKFPIARGFASKIECLDDFKTDAQKADWKHPDRRYRFDIEDGGKITKLYTNQIDIASGPGPGKTLPIGAGGFESQADADELAKENPDKGYTPYATGNDYTNVAKKGVVVVFGASPSAAWAAQYAKHGGASKVVWVGDKEYMPTRENVAAGKNLPRGWGPPLQALYEQLGDDAPWIQTYIGDRNKEAIKTFSLGGSGAYSRQYSKIGGVVKRGPDASAKGDKKAKKEAQDAKPAPDMTVKLTEVGEVEANQLVYCTGADTEAKGGIAQLAQNVEGGKDGGRFDYVPIFPRKSHAEVLAVYEQKDGKWWTEWNAEDSGPPLGMTDRSGGVRILGASGNNLANKMGEGGREYNKRLEYFYKQLPPEMQTPDGIALNGMQITEANKKKAKPGEDPEIEPNTAPESRTQMININVSMLFDLFRIPAFGENFKPKASLMKKKEYAEFASAMAGLTVADVIIAARSGSAIVIPEVDQFETDKRKESNPKADKVMRNKVDGFSHVSDLWKMGICSHEEVQPYLQWLRV